MRLNRRLVRRLWGDADVWRGIGEELFAGRGFLEEVAIGGELADVLAGFVVLH